MKKIAQGAEAIIFEINSKSHPLRKNELSVKNQRVNLIIKERFEKKYRIPELDKPLRQFRTRREAKILQKLEEIEFPAPTLIEYSDKNMTISMSKIEGIKLRDYLLSEEYISSIGIDIGKRVGQLHHLNIIHQDLTTSNMIKTEKGVSLIDFGLSFFSEKDEDKAVDLFLLERAIESTHWTILKKIWPDIITGYKLSNPKSDTVIVKMEQVQSRGRNKKKND